MTAIESAIYTRLKNDAGVAALVSTRIYPNIARQSKVMPFIVYYMDRAPEHHLGGASNLITADLTVECYAEGETAYADVRTLAAAVRASLDGYRGTAVDADGNNISVRTCIMEADADSFLPPVDGGEKGTHVSVQTYSIGYFDNDIPSPS